MTVLDTNLISNFLRHDARRRYPETCAFVEPSLGAADDPGCVCYLTVFELRRGFQEIVIRTGSRRRLVALEKFLEHVGILGLDDDNGEGWNEAASLWARSRARLPGRVFSEADFLIAATAAYHGLATSDRRLAEGLRAVDFPAEVILIRERAASG